MNRIKATAASALLVGVLLAGIGTAGAAQHQDIPYVYGESGKPVISLRTFAGIGDFGNENGQAAKAAFREPQSLVAADDGTVYVADGKNNRIRKISGNTVSTYAGVSVKRDNRGYPVGGLLDGSADASFFNRPGGIAGDANGNLYVADTENNAIRKISKDGSVTTLAGDGILGSSDGKGNAARFSGPKDVAAAGDGTVFVADALNNAIRKIAADGTVTTLNALSARVVENIPGHVLLAGDFADGALNQAKFNEPSGLALDAKGNLFVSDTGNQRIRYIDFSTGTVSTVAGSVTAADGKSVYENTSIYAAGDFADGKADTALFNFPIGLALTPDGGLLIADSLNNSIRLLQGGVVTTIAGESTQAPGQRDGIEGAGELNRPTDVVLTADGTILVADSFNNKVKAIRFFRLPDGLPADDSIKVVANDRLIEFDAKPELANGRTMVPVHFIAEALGYQIDYVNTGQFILLKKGNTVIEMIIGKQEVRRSDAANKQPLIHSMDVSPYIKEDRTYVPVRFFAEEAGLDVQWLQASHTALIRTKTR